MLLLTLTLRKCGASSCPSSPSSDGDVRWVKQDAGSCPAGTHFIDTIEECGEAAADLELTPNTPDSILTRGLPYGCYFKLSANELYFNPAGSITNDDINRVSLCALRDTYFLAEGSDGR